MTRHKGFTVFRKIHIKQIIVDLDSLLVVNGILSDDFSHIRFKYINKSSLRMPRYLLSKTKDISNLINLKFIEIYQKSMLSPDEFQFWWNVLRSSRTRSSLTSICLEFSLLSESLTFLSLCSGCPKLKSVDFWYLEAEVKNEHKKIKYAKRKFRKEWEFIQKLKIRKSKE